MSIGDMTKLGDALDDMPVECVEYREADTLPSISDNRFTLNRCPDCDAALFNRTSMELKRV